MDKSLLLDLYELTMAQGYFVYHSYAQASFDLFVRKMSPNRAYLVACGLEDVIDYLKNLRFSRKDLEYLRKQKLFSEDFLKYLSSFKFSGALWAMPEGTIFFSGEPIIRVTAPIIEAQIIETFLLNTINLQTMIASKAVRVVCTAGESGVYDFSLRRTHGSEAGLKVARASYIAGCSGTSNCLAGKLYNIPVVGTMAHSFVMSFRQEIDSFLAYSDVFPQRSILLVDTYETKKGIENAVLVGLYLREKGFKLLGIRLDSGNIVSLSRFARRAFDKAGLDYVKIFASGNLDEFKIKDLLDKGAVVDNFGVGTNMGTSIDAPCLDVIYKMSEVTNEDGRFFPTMKLSKAKVTYPGKKQVFRVKDKRGRFTKDILALDGERVFGRPLLVKIMDKGRLVYKMPSLEEIRKNLRDNLDKFTPELKEARSCYKYPVLISSGLKKLRRSLMLRLERKQ